MFRKVTIDCLAIRDWETFHDAFEQAFGFPGWYGRNLGVQSRHLVDRVEDESIRL